MIEEDDDTICPHCALSYEECGPLVPRCIFHDTWERATVSDGCVRIEMSEEEYQRMRQALGSDWEWHSDVTISQGPARQWAETTAAPGQTKELIEELKDYVKDLEISLQHERQANERISRALALGHPVAQVRGKDWQGRCHQLRIERVARLDNGALCIDVSL